MIRLKLRLLFHFMVFEFFSLYLLTIAFSAGIIYEQTAMDPDFRGKTQNMVLNDFI